MKPCKFCGEIIPKSCKICPKCLAKQPNNDVVKYIIIGVVVLLFLIGAIFGSDEENTDTPNSQTPSKQEQNVNQNVEDQDEPEIVYNKYTVDALLDELDENALKAEKTHQNEYIEVTGILEVIDSDGDYISLGRLDGDWSLINVTCYIQNEEQINQVVEMKIGDTVTIKGKITSIGEILGYSVDIDSIN